MVLGYLLLILELYGDYNAVLLLSGLSISGSSPRGALQVGVLNLLWSLQLAFLRLGASFWFFWWVHRLTGFWRCCVQHGTGISSHHKELLFFILGFSRYCITSRSWGRGDLSARWDWCQGMAVPAHDMVSSRWSITVLCTLLLGPFPWAGTTAYTAHAYHGVSWTLYKVGSQASWILFWPWGLLRI